MGINGLVRKKTESIEFRESGVKVQKIRDINKKNSKKIMFVLENDGIVRLVERF